MKRALLIVVLLVAGGVLAVHAVGQPSGRQGGSRQPVQSTRLSEVPAHPFDLILGRPTSTSVVISVLCYQGDDGSVAYGTESGKLGGQTPVRSFKAGEPGEVLLSGLKPDTRYLYQFRTSRMTSAELAFHTARPAGRPFTFTVTADSHLDDRTEAAVYQRTLANARADNPDFHVDLGDTFMTDKHASRDDAAKQYVAQRYYLGQLAQSVPLFLALGNHDGERARGRGDEGLVDWSAGMRTRYFPNPVPNQFYTGNTSKLPGAGPIEDYYAWEWGDALFVVLDPFRYSQPGRGPGDNWTQSLGDEQYKWLTRTLETSKAAFTFVFIHHLVGGADAQNRGGAEAAALYEWGGRSADGSDGFAQHRPGWALPIHQLLVRHHVTIVFHGHDHFYAKQDLDGVVYQEVPQPGYPGDAREPRSAAEYGYTTGTILGSSGHLRVKVSPERTTVDYVRSEAGPSAAPAHAYVVARPAAAPSR